jgi:hypothetical protein
VPIHGPRSLTGSARRATWSGYRGERAGGAATTAGRRPRTAPGRPIGAGRGRPDGCSALGEPRLLAPRVTHEPAGAERCRRDPQAATRTDRNGVTGGRPAARRRHTPRGNSRPPSLTHRRPGHHRPIGRSLEARAGRRFRAQSRARSHGPGGPL